MHMLINHTKGGQVRKPDYFPVVFRLFFNRALKCDYQQCGILTSVDSDKTGEPPFKLRTSK